MARFNGEVGFGESTEQPPDSGVWVDVITEKTYTGDVIRDARNLDANQSVNGTLSVGNSISIVADQYAIENFFNVRYVRWAGVRWIVTNVVVQRPRLILSLGGVYNGPTP